MDQERLTSYLLTVAFASTSIDGLDMALDIDTSFPPAEFPEGCARISVSVVEEGLSSRQHEQQAPIVIDIYLTVVSFQVSLPPLPVWCSCCCLSDQDPR
jgi:hypothetical protein